MDFEQAKKVLQLTEGRIKRFGAFDTSISDEIQRAIFRFQPFQRLVIAHHAQEALTRLREQIAPLENSLEQLIATAIKLNHAEFREFADPSMDKLTLRARKNKEAPPDLGRRRVVQRREECLNCLRLSHDCGTVNPNSKAAPKSVGSCVLADTVSQIAARHWGTKRLGARAIS